MALALFSHLAWSQANNDKVEADAGTEKESPWLLAPTVSSNPKLGNTLGFLAGYLHKFDEQSPSSMVAIAASTSDTDSTVAGMFGRVFFDQDRQRILAGHARGKILNEYEDFLGTGLNINTTDDLTLTLFRYLHRVQGNWFLGGQLIRTEYTIEGDDPFSKLILQQLGLTGFEGNALGLSAERDTRDNQNSPYQGSHTEIHTNHYRDAWGSDVEFDVVTAKYAHFARITGRQVLAARFNTRITADAPISGYSSLDLRGYTRGEYLAPHVATFEVEDRIKLGNRWGATLFAGASCLFGEKARCDNREDWYPAVGAGITYQLKVEERMNVRAEIALGKHDNYGFYLQFGNAF
ncbi:surface antigen (D15) [Simiduia agarivorans SA1 = DSM 21679]|uniref:Surface antigen (D15) n=2 Tax=Simiduia TaxID=447467 RepID=K4KMB8_SIMAS|nr:surface antigen (D15) [Simiduia agarivorans SA1 = DSM 21679]